MIDNLNAGKGTLPVKAADAPCSTPIPASSRAWALSFARCRRTAAPSAAAPRQEFHVLADSGEDAIGFSDADDYAANVESAATLPSAAPRPAASQALAKVPTRMPAPLPSSRSFSKSRRRGA